MTTEDIVAVAKMQVEHHRELQELKEKITESVKIAEDAIRAVKRLLK